MLRIVSETDNSQHCVLVGFICEGVVEVFDLVAFAKIKSLVCLCYWVGKQWRHVTGRTFGLARK